MRDVVIVSGARTPVGNFNGCLQDVPVVQMGALVLKETLKKAGLKPVATDAQKEVAPDALVMPGIPTISSSASSMSANTSGRMRIGAGNRLLRNTLRSSSTTTGMKRITS